MESIEIAPFRELCTDCGVSRTKQPKRCATACQFIQPNYPQFEISTHGRVRNAGDSDEVFFGTYLQMYRARLNQPLEGAQWTGIITRLCELLLERGLVDAVITMASDPEDKWRPQPVIINRAQDMKLCRGMKMGYAPIVQYLEQAKELGHQRVAMVGIPCQVYAARALEKELGFEKLFIIGSPCSDNTTTENFHHFLGLLSQKPEEITYLEFRADYHVELRFADGRIQEIPFLKLPLSDLPGDFFPTTCKTCVDYVNSLSDITVGYMAGTGEQWLIVRNARGQELAKLLGLEIHLEALQSAGNRLGPVKGFMKNVELAAGGLPLQRMPNFMRSIFAWVMPRFGPRGLEFAKARVEMKAIESVIHLRNIAPHKIKNMVPSHVWQVVRKYGLEPRNDEIKDSRESTYS
ncbi:Coenzyme F420 hydrogenase/dehydrogenase, beta subunit C-terminal domain [Polynucleobacter sp. MWH-Berg-3C6]|uniref:Coenzyme F420 hydrogenase/dehydrogenase, beta subunit C-terminal domain n=1 Tax=Polynucleobacter sp. MWH-Berg-3C6 TaxID=1855882 RepID=UPI001C0AE029|nr:Coenzyme F420 hydrogenase/dehydrogenase, beta subunit C-terminal domain [Polynucleobacter sp. MWH-Berg-3C6]MBU3550172.1 Coenzyme F420 hydrogenase/dehydrogenase, beta subunit C-terminal domain [Polynucleobacter sp. MWH-Berg-3C6]